MNKLSKQLSEFRSIKDLPVKKLFKVIGFEIVETTNGRCVRCRLEDDSVDEGYFFIHLPRRFLEEISRNFKRYTEITNSHKPFYFCFLGFKGRGFQVLFTRNPKKSI